MPDSTPLIEQMAAYVRTLPATPQGAFKVENPEALAVEFIGIAAPAYQADIDALEQRALTAEAAHRMGDSETSGLRNDVDALRDAVARAAAALATDDVAAARVILDGATQV